MYNNAPAIMSAKEALLLCDTIERQIFFTENPKSRTRTIYPADVRGTVTDRKSLFIRFTEMFYRLYLDRKRNPGVYDDLAIDYLMTEFNNVYLYGDCWEDDDMIACNGMFLFLKNFPEMTADILNRELNTVCHPLTLFIASIIWIWPCEYLVKTCRILMKTDPDNPLTPSIKDILMFIYPDSFYVINTPYLKKIMSIPDPKTTALALFRQKHRNVTPPKRNIKLFKECFGCYPTAKYFKEWRDIYRKFLILIDQDPTALGF